MRDSFLLHGTPAPPTEPLQLRAGLLTLLFEPETGMIRRICYGDTEIWRGLYAAVRDQNWGTIPPRLFNLKTDIQDDSFRISFDVECKSGEIDFIWHGFLRGSSLPNSPGVVLYRMTGEARSTFLRNRIGFCLLHPPQCKGQRCQLHHTDGTKEMAHFPDAIAPHQPFKNLRVFNHEFVSGQWAQAGFHGETFETEDQRNWTDASFKTYCTPLDLPFPVAIQKGTKIEQGVTLRLLSSGLQPPKIISIKQNDAIAIQLEEGDSPAPLPDLGLCMASHGEPLTENEIARLRLLHMSHLRADLRFNTNWQLQLKQAAHEARALNTRLELALHLPQQPQQILREVVAELEENEVALARFLIFSDGEKVTTENTAWAAREVLASCGAPLVGGTDFYFTEINRQHPPIKFLDSVCFSITPQVHAFDNLSLMENIETQATVVKNARRLFGDLPIHISPVTFKKRHNPDATSAELQTSSNELPSDVDARQMSLFGAAWTLGSLKSLSEAGAASVTYYETTGLRGVMQQENAMPHPLFPAPANCTLPLFDVLAGAHNLQYWSSCSSSKPTIVQGWLMFAHDAHWLWLVNFTPDWQEAKFPEIKNGGGIIWDESNIWQAITSPKEFAVNNPHFRGNSITLRPYAVALLSWMKSSQ